MDLEKRNRQSSNNEFGSAAMDITLKPRDLNLDFAAMDINSKSRLPSVTECTVHLKLLEAFYRLRKKICTTDGLFGLSHTFRTADGLEKPEEALQLLQEKRWAIYVTRAADRFESWWKSCVPKTQQSMRQSDAASTGNIDRMLDLGKPLDLKLPPLGKSRSMFLV